MTFYRFFNWSEEKLREVESALLALDKKIPVRGLIILGREGINTTLSIESTLAEQLKSELRDILSCDDIWFKESQSERHPFHDYKIKIREEIVTLNRPDIIPGPSHRHLSPKDWNKVLKEEEPLVIDTRNSYEYEIGHFKGAIDPKTEEFSEFPQWLANSGLPKDKKVLIYCTGGIRCEKAIYALEEQGYNNSYQLEGGILNYLKEFPNDEYKGECFVFDYRVAVDQNLQPTQKYKLCPHCGQPGSTKIECKQCGESSVNCDKCLESAPEHHTCSKNCAHHFRMGHKTTRIHTDSFRKRAPL